MLNVLVDEFLPVSLEVDEVEFEIDSDFRPALRTLMAFEDSALTNYEKAFVMLQNLYFETPENTEEAIKQAQWFLNCGDDSEEESGRRLFSWKKDAGFIFAAFNATHGIDLQEAKVHWWKFVALFMDLGQNTTFCQLTSLRKRYFSGKCTKEEKAMIREMGSVFTVEQTQVEDDPVMRQIRENAHRVHEMRKNGK